MSPIEHHESEPRSEDYVAGWNAAAILGCAVIERVARERDEARQQLRGAVSRADRLQHIIDCADTPLMRDVMKERDEARAQLRGAVDALCYFAVDESAFETQDSVAVSITKEHAAKLRALVRDLPTCDLVQDRDA